MPVSRVNHTGRIRIRQSSARVTVTQGQDGQLSFDADLSLGEYGSLPANAEVFVEAYRQSAWMRFNYGTISDIQRPEDIILTAFDEPTAIFFRVKVSDGKDGKLLAVADRIRPSVSDDEQVARKWLLPVKGDAGLRDQIVKVDFSNEDTILLVNSSVGNWRELIMTPAFVSLVLPLAFREILTRILRVLKHFDTDDDVPWSHWLTFASGLPGVGQSPSQDDEENELDDWIDAAVDSFSRKHNAKALVLQFDH